VRLLLQAAGIGQDRARLRSQRREVEIAEGGQGANVSAELEALARERSPRAWVHRKDDRPLDAAQSLEDPTEPRLGRVRLAVHGRACADLARSRARAGRARRRTPATTRGRSADRYGARLRRFRARAAPPKAARI